MESIVRLLWNIFLQNELFTNKQYSFIDGKPTTLQLLNLGLLDTKCIEEGDKWISFTQILKRHLKKNPS